MVIWSAFCLYAFLRYAASYYFHVIFGRNKKQTQKRLEHFDIYISQSQYMHFSIAVRYVIVMLYD